MKKMVKSLLLGTAAGFVAVAGAQAADMPVKAKPVQYVKICSLYGDAFYYIPGTDTCLKLGGYLRVQAEYNAGAGGVPDTSGNQGFRRATTGPTPTTSTTAPGSAVVGRAPADRIRHAAHLCPHRRQVTTPADTEAGAAFWDRAFMQFAGFTVGKTQSFFDLFTYGGGMSYHNVRTSGDTGAAGLTVWAYTAQFGNGFSGTLSLEAPQGHNRAPVFDGTVAASSARRRSSPTAPSISKSRRERLPVPGHRRQPAGRSGLGLLRHQRRPPQLQRRLLLTRQQRQQRPSQRQARLGGRDWRTVQPRGGDQIGANFCYSEGAAGFCTNTGLCWATMPAPASSLGWITDGVFDTGTAVEQTRVWSALAGYQHIWNPKWRTSLYGGYVNIEYGGAARDIINSHFARRVRRLAAWCRRQGR